ncbi:MAG: hypothetical protein JRG94_23670, partial [Deltaproteobacteria bacterium]|nr:hypothetical protein [Deltaproteobacteria bacterium]
MENFAGQGHSMTASEPSERATQLEVEQYERDGFFAREAVFSEAELKPLRDAVEAVHRKIEEAAGVPDVEAPRLFDGKQYQKILGSSVQWEWREDSSEIRTMEPYHHLDPALDELI